MARLGKEIKDIEARRDNAAILVDTAEGDDSLFIFSLRRKRQPRQC